jgi:hypothetical protein
MKWLLAVCALVLLNGCSPKDSKLLALRPSEVPANAYISSVVENGKVVPAWVVNDRESPNGIKVIMILDYPCGFIGPLPDGHGRDCYSDLTASRIGDPDSPERSGDPDTSERTRSIGDPTADDAADADGSVVR